MKFLPTTLSGVWHIELELNADARGFLARTFCEAVFSKKGLVTVWPQCNLSYTRKRGALRGMHFQSQPRPENKLIRCVAGEIYDVLLDLRRGSPTFGKWEGFELTAKNRRSLYVPAGIAHGFQCLTDDCEIFYKMSEVFVPELARGVRWNDPLFQIRWPLEPTVISKKDRQLPDFKPEVHAQ